jgi:CheY-like chemotaxis protein
MLQNFESYEKYANKKLAMEIEPMPYGNVLIVDDVAANLYVAKGLMAFYDINVETCDSGFEAIKKVEQGNIYDIIFIDYMMPGMNGIEAMHKMREMGYHHPIVILTANAMIGQSEAFMKEGFDGFVSKPIQTELLDAILTKFIMKKQPQEVIEAARKERKKSSGKENIADCQSNPELLAKLRKDFINCHSNSFAEITTAMEAGDLYAAYRISHKIKGAAGLIFENELAHYAKEVELILEKEVEPPKSKLSALEDELLRVLAAVAEVSETETTVVNTMPSAEAKQLLATVVNLLADKDNAVVKMVGEISKISQSEQLCTQIENYNFKAALETANNLLSSLEG